MKVTEKRIIKWIYNDVPIELIFSNKIFQIEFMESLQQILLIADYREVGERNLFIYNINGKIIANPAMPNIGTPVEGVYSFGISKGKQIKRLCC